MASRPLYIVLIDGMPIVSGLSHVYGCLEYQFLLERIEIVKDQPPPCMEVKQ
jgi:hypothetical protein